MLPREKGKFRLMDTAARFTLVCSQLVLNGVLQFSCTGVSGQYLGCKHTRETAHLLISANQIWVCTAGGPSAGRKGGSLDSSYPGAAGFCVAQATAAPISALWKEVVKKPSTGLAFHVKNIQLTDAHC